MANFWRMSWTRRSYGWLGSDDSHSVRNIGRIVKRDESNRDFGPLIARDGQREEGSRFWLHSLRITFI